MATKLFETSLEHRTHTRASMTDDSEQLRQLRRQYFSLYPLHQLVLPNSSVLARNQAFLKGRIIADPSLGRYQPDAGYQKTFWRRVVSALEDGVRNLVEEDTEIVRAPTTLICGSMLKLAGGGRGFLRIDG